nr:DNA cytosine methyltransferase [Terribacillus saccharophilus]
MTKKYCLLDLFSGAGGLSAGFERTGGFEVVGAVEINQVLKKHS